MAKVVSRVEMVREQAGRSCMPTVSRAVVFEIMCDAIDVLSDLPEEVREEFAALIGRAYDVGWRETS